MADSPAVTIDTTLPVEASFDMDLTTAGRQLAERLIHDVRLRDAQAVNVNPDGTPHTGAMVALVPSDADLDRLVLEDGESRDQLHLTLYFLGDAAEIPGEVQEEILDEVEFLASTQAPLVADVFAVDLFNPAGAEPAWVLGIGGDGLTDLRDLVSLTLDRAVTMAEAEDGAMWALPGQHAPWVAHVTLAYGAAPGDGRLEALAERTGPVTFDRIRVSYGTRVADFPLAGEGDDQTVTASAATDVEDVAMPYGIRSGGEGCPFEVFNEDTDERAPGGCHDTEQDAQDHVAALNSNVDDAGTAGDAAAVIVPDLDPQPGEHFHSVAHTEGESTGMRTFTNLEWRDPPFAFHWQKGSAAHGGTPMTVHVGLVTRATRDPMDDAAIHMFGTLDLEDPDGREYGRKLVAGFTRWVSIGLDEMPAEVEMVWPDGEDADGDDIEAILFGEPEQVLIDGGRIGELTGVSVPAQDNATIEPTAELVRALEALGAAAPFPGGEAPGEGDQCPEGQVWDPDAGECVPVPEQVPEAAAVPSRPVLVIERDAAGVRVVGTRARQVPAAPHSATQAGWEGASMADVVQGITAASYRIEIPNLPPAWWFDEPTDVGDLPGAFCITDDGRIYGIIAPLNTGHRAFTTSGRRVTVPRGNVDYSRFLGGEALTLEGRLSGVGPITMDCRHASRWREDHDVAPDHYENACAVIGKIRCGETADGLPWAAGALEPGVTPDQVSRMLACRLSGDWQPHPDRPGWQELIATLLVPSPGFAQGRRGPTVTTRDGVLVASSVPVRYVGDVGDRLERHHNGDGDLDGIEGIAASAGRTPWARRARRLNRALGGR